MMRTLRAEYVNGAVQILEPCNLKEGARLTVTFEDELVSGEQEATNDGQESIMEMFERLRESVPAEARGSLPPDGARNYKHYLYGHPKVEDE